MVRDLNYALRQLAGAPAFTFAAVVSLALGIAVNSATFSVISALLLRPLATTDDGDLVRIGRSTLGETAFRSSSYRDFLYLRDHAATLREVFGEQVQPLTLGGSEGAEVVSGEFPIISGAGGSARTLVRWDGPWRSTRIRSPSLASHRRRFPERSPVCASMSGFRR